MDRARPRLYLITPPQIKDLPAFSTDLRAAMSGGDVACVQLRLKDIPDDDVIRIGGILKPIVHEHGAAFIVNDNPDIADILGADGVHIGRNDGTYARARAVMGADRIVGCTCHASRHTAMEAAENGADYVAFGAFFPTVTKTPSEFASEDILEWWQTLFEVPCVAIGGITPKNAPSLVTAGADFLAVSGSIWTAPNGPGAAVAAFNAVFEAFSP